MYLLLGLYTITEGFLKVKAENQVVWITADDEVKWHYRKEHPAQGLEQLVTGDGIIPVDQTGSGAIASVICFEMDLTTYRVIITGRFLLYLPDPAILSGDTARTHRCRTGGRWDRTGYFHPHCYATRARVTGDGCAVPVYVVLGRLYGSSDLPD